MCWQNVLQGTRDRHKNDSSIFVGFCFLSQICIFVFFSAKTKKENTFTVFVFAADSCYKVQDVFTTVKYVIIMMIPRTIELLIIVYSWSFALGRRRKIVTYAEEDQLSLI